MKKNKLKEKLNRKQVTIGSWLTIGNEITTEIMASTNFDWLVIDMEHSVIDLPTAQNMIRIIDLMGVCPLVRVGENNPTIIKRVMDAGAYGVIVPMVNSKDEAERAVSAVKYPTTGTRGVGLARAQGYGISFEEYKKWLKNESVVIVQVEHIDSVSNLESIMKVKGVDGFIVGPYDLSGSLGCPGEFNKPIVKHSLKNVKKISEKLNLNAGIHVIPPDFQEVNNRIKEGYNFVAFSLDTLFLNNSCKEALDKIRR